MSEEYTNNVVDLSAFRKQKEKERAEKERLEKEQQQREEIEEMRIVLINIMEQLGADPSRTGSIFYAPMPDEQFYSHYTFDSGYNDDGYYESTWEWDSFREDDEYYFSDRDTDEDE